MLCETGFKQRLKQVDYKGFFEGNECNTAKFNVNVYVLTCGDESQIEGVVSQMPSGMIDSHAEEDI